MDAEAVRRAAELVREAGYPPSVRKVRQITGGSLRDIHQIMKTLGLIIPAKPYFLPKRSQPEVDRLLATFAPLPGTNIPYEAIEEVLGCTRHEERFRRYVAQWRRRLFTELNMDTDPIPGKAIRMLPSHERIYVSERDFGYGTRKVYRAKVRISAVPAAELSGLDLQRKDHAQRQIVSGLLAVQQARRAIEAPKAVAMQPWAQTSEMC